MDGCEDVAREDQPSEKNNLGSTSSSLFVIGLRAGRAGRAGGMSHKNVPRRI
jgi:hypothetical protein